MGQKNSSNFSQRLVVFIDNLFARKDLVKGVVALVLLFIILICWILYSGGQKSSVFQAEKDLKSVMNVNGRLLTDSERQKVKDSIDLLNSGKIKLTDDEILQLMRVYNKKSNTSLPVSGTGVVSPKLKTK